MTEAAISQETLRVIANYTPALLSKSEWALARPLVTSLVKQWRPATTEGARVALSYLCRFLLTCSAWDRTASPNPARIFTPAQFAHVDARLALAGYTTNTRASVQAVVRRVTMDNPVVTRSRSAKTVQKLPAPCPLTQTSSQWQIRAWLIPHLEASSDFALLDFAMRRGAGRKALTGRFIDAALPYLTWSTPATYAAQLASAELPMPRPAKQKPMAPKRTSAAAAKRAAKAARAAHPAIPRSVALPTEVESFIDSYCPRNLTATEYAPRRQLTAEFVRASAPTCLRNAKRLMPYSSAYIAWVHKHAIAEPSVADLADLLLLDRYIDSGHPDLSEGTKATHRSTLATAITAILGGGRRKETSNYRGGSAPYSPAEEQAFSLLAQHQSTALKRARLATVVALGAGAGLDSGDLRGIRPVDIELTVDPVGAYQVTVHNERRPRTVVVRNTHRELLASALRWHAEAGLADTDSLLGCDGNRNVASRVVEQSQTATGEPVRIEIARLRTTWLLALMNERLPLTIILQAAGLKSARPIADLIPYLPEPDPTQFADLLAGIGS